MNPTQTKLLSKSFFSILFIALFFSSTAQTKSINKFYLQGGIGASTHNGGFGDISLQTIIKNKWSVTLSYQSMTMDPKNLPSDYQPETGYVLFIPYTYQVTTDMNIVSLTAGRNFKLGRNVWATTEGGPSYVSGEKINFQRMDVVSSNAIIIASTGANYATFREKKNAIGLSMRADLNWAFSSFMGLGCGVFTNINSIQSPVGAQVKLIIGYMGREKKRK
jgi:hypothetical protein